MPPAITDNTLYYGDNLDILREYLPDESVDLIYLDPPFNSNRNYNVLFREEGGQASEAQIMAFGDTWHWGPSAERTYQDLVTCSPPAVAKMVAALHDFIGPNQMLAYLVMMAARLAELHRVLKPTGSLYLHCDTTASHYLKIVLDTIFNPQNYRNEITWKRYAAHNDVKRNYASITDTILFYSKSERSVFNVQRKSYDPAYIEKFFRNTDENGRRYSVNNLASPNPRPNLTYEYKGFPPPPNGWKFTRERLEELDRQGKLYFPKDPRGRIRLKYYLDELVGAPVSNLWDDVQALAGSHAERLGYPTQKPEALLERILQASSNPGDIVLDPFCGCGTAIAAAQKLGRRWIGIDITHLAITLQKARLKDAYGLEANKDYKVIGEPYDLHSARQLASDNRYQFQWWALSLVGAWPVAQDESGKGKKGADRGIDGLINFIDDNKGRPASAVVQVKSGHVKSGDIRDLNGVMQREHAPVGVFVTLEKPTRDMLHEATVAGCHYSALWQVEIPRIQIKTVEELLSGHGIEIPAVVGPHQKAERVRQPQGRQEKMNI